VVFLRSWNFLYLKADWLSLSRNSRTFLHGLEINPEYQKSLARSLGSFELGTFIETFIGFQSMASGVCIFSKYAPPPQSPWGDDIQFEGTGDPKKCERKRGGGCEIQRKKEEKRK
jgi:hypothetical protein